LPGEIGNARERVPVARALRPSSTVRSLSRLGHSRSQGLQRSDFLNRSSAASTGKCGTPGERCRTSTVVSPLLAAGRQELRSTNDAARVAGPGRICFWRRLSCHGLARARGCRVRPVVPQLSEPLLQSVFSGLPQNVLFLHSFCPIYWANSLGILLCCADNCCR
jgi:hypothetical protein